MRTKYTARPSVRKTTCKLQKHCAERGIDHLELASILGVNRQTAQRWLNNDFLTMQQYHEDLINLWLAENHTSGKTFVPKGAPAVEPEPTLVAVVPPPLDPLTRAALQMLVGAVQTGKDTQHAMALAQLVLERPQL